MVKKFYNQWFYLISFMPLWVLVIGNFLNRSLFAHHSLSKGFVEDYPALWLMAVGLIINWTLLRKYRHLITFAGLNYVYQNKVKSYVLHTFVFLSSLVINHQWVILQLNNKDISWFSYKGKMPYIFAETIEKFNWVGIIYYISCLFFWTLLLKLVFYLISSMFLYAQKIKKRELFNFSKSTYLYFSSAIVFSIMFFYTSFQINDIFLEGFETFILHPNRLIMLVFSLILLIVFTFIPTLVKYQPMQDEAFTKSIFRREIFF